MIRGSFLTSLAGRRFSSFEAVRGFLTDMVFSPICQRNLSAFCAFELALLDLSSNYWDQSLEDLFRTVWKEPPPYSAVIPILPPHGLKSFLALLQKHDMRYIKIKVDTHLDPVVFEETRLVLGPDAHLRVDANGAWTAKEAVKNIQRLETYGVRAVEQPVAKEDLRGLREVTANSRVLIVADESACSVEDARRLAEMKACHVINIRLSKCGGLLRSMAIADIARTAGMRFQIGCQVGETGILSAAGRHLAGWFEDLLYLEGSFGTWVLQEDIIEEDIRFGRGGRAWPLEGKGLGVHVKQDALNRYARRSEKVEL
jgi:muconate cycloisomerase